MAPLGVLNWDDAAPVEDRGEAEALVGELSEEVEEVVVVVVEPAMKKGVLV